MSNYIIGLLFLFILSFKTGLSQDYEKWSDSVSVSYLRQIFPYYGIGIKKDTLNGKTMLIRNYYCFETFRLKNIDSSTIYVYNFGPNSSEGKNFIMIVDRNMTIKTFFVLGKNKFEDDLETLNIYFKNRSNSLSEKYQIEIADLFLRCKRGQIKTPKYIH